MGVGRRSRASVSLVALVGLLSGVCLCGGAFFGIQRALAADPLVTTPNAVVPPGQPGWAADTVYAATGPTIYQVGGDGSLTPFVTLTCDTVAGLTFDEVGSFNDRLIATCLNGAVYTVAPDGTAGWLAAAPTGLSVPVVLPASLPFAGLLAASDALGTTWTVSPAGDVQQLITADVAATVTGGGTVLAVPTFPTTLASFGLNARRPPGFTAGGLAIGRINYDLHADVPDNHVNVPVVLMAGELTATPTPNGTGGSAVLVGDCTAVSAKCPEGSASVLVFVVDNADSGSGSDVFEIFFCVFPPILPQPSFHGETPPVGCTGPEGFILRTGNIQVR